VERLAEMPGNKAAIHAQVALAGPMIRTYEQLSVDAVSGAPDAPVERPLTTTPPDLKAACEALSTLLKERREAAESLGNIDYNYYVSRLSQALADEGRVGKARNVLDGLIAALSERNVATGVINGLRMKRETIGKTEAVGIDMRAVAIEPSSRDTAKT
jgi:hypothetical protein